MIGSSECPDFFPMTIDDERGATKWIFWSANNTYLIGDFDGKKFVDQSGPLRDVVGANYAAQTFSDIPAADGRRVQIAWMRDGRYPGMPFNQQMSFPVVLSLRRFPQGLRLTQSPVKELSLLRDQRYAWSGELESSTNPLADLAVDACEIRTTIDPADAETIVFTIRGLTLTYDPATHRLSTPKHHCSLPVTDGKVRLVILVDRTSVEVFAQDGRVLLTQCFLPRGDERLASLSGAGANVESLECWTLKSSWRGPNE
jgi:fructan beta-fructosidase